MKNSPLQRFWTKGISLAVAFSLVFTLQTPPVRAQNAETPAAPLPVDLSKLEIPEALGRIEGTGSGTGKPVILIQDAHAIPEAQQRIADLITHFHAAYGVSLVAFEGASTKIDARLFRSFPDKKVFEKVFREYMENSELTGVNAAALRAGAKIDFQGIEEWALYEEGTQTFLLALEKEPVLLTALGRFEKELRTAKEAAYTPELLALDGLLGRFWKNEASLEEVLLVLGQRAAPPEGSALEAIFREMKSNGERAARLEEETRLLAERIRSEMPETRAREVQMTFNEKYQDFRTGRLGAKEFAHYLYSMNPHLELSPELASATRDARRLKDIDGTAFFRELELYIERVKETLIGGDEQRLLDKKDTALRLAGKLIRLELTRSDLNLLRKLRAGKDDGLKDIAGLLESMQEHLRFYETAETREIVFFERLQALLGSGEKTSAVFVAGGFHAQGMTARFTAAGIPWILVTPALSEVPENIPYREHMRGEVSWKNYFTVENGKINLYDSFVRAARDRLVAEAETGRGTTLKAWRDQILRDLAAEGEIEKAGEYTKFIDEAVEKPLHTASEIEWKANAERFLAELRKLEQAGGINQQNVSALLRQMTSAELILSNILNPGAETRLYVSENPGYPDEEEIGRLFAGTEFISTDGDARSELRASDERGEEMFRKALDLFIAKRLISETEGREFFEDPQGAIIRLRTAEPEKLAVSISISVKVRGVQEQRNITLEQLLANAARRRGGEASPPADTAVSAAPASEFANLDFGPPEIRISPASRARTKHVSPWVWFAAGAAAIGLAVTLIMVSIPREAEKPGAPAKKAPEPAVERPAVKAPEVIPEPFVPAPRIPKPLIAPAALAPLDEQTAAFYQREATAYNNYIKEETGLIRFVYTARDGRMRSAYALSDHIAGGERMTYSQPLAMGTLVNALSQQIEGNLPQTVKDPLAELDNLLDFFDAWHQRFGAPVSWLQLEKNERGQYVALLNPRLQGEARIGHSSEDYLGFLGNLLVANGALKAALENPANAAQAERIRSVRAKLLRTAAELKSVFNIMADPESGSLWAGVHLEEGAPPAPVKTRVIDRFSEDMEATFLAVALGFLPESVIRNLELRPVTYFGADGNWTAASSVYGAAFQMPGYNGIIDLRRLYKPLDDLYDGTEAAFIHQYSESKGASYFPGSAFGTGGRYYSHAGHPKLSEVAKVKSNMIVPGFSAIAGERSRLHLMKTFGHVNRINPLTGVPYESFYRDEYEGEKILAGVPFHSAVVAPVAAVVYSHRLDATHDILAFLDDEAHHGVPGLRKRLDDIIRKKFGLEADAVETIISPPPADMEAGEKAPGRVISEAELPAKIVDGRVEVFTNLMPKPASIGIFTAAPAYPGNFAWLTSSDSSVIYYNLAADANETSGVFWKTRRIDPEKIGTAELILGDKAEVPAEMGADVTLELKDEKGTIGEKVVIDRVLIKPDAKILVDLTKAAAAAAGRGPVTEVVLTFTGKDTKGNFTLKSLVLHERELDLLARAAVPPGAVGIYTEKPRFAGNLTTLAPDKTLKIEYNVNRENKLAGVYIAQAYDPRLYRQMRIRFTPDAADEINLPAAFLEVKDEKGLIVERIPLDIPADFRKTNTVVVDLEKVREAALAGGRGPVKETNLVFPYQEGKPAAGTFTVRSILLSANEIHTQPTSFFDVELPEAFHPMEIKVLDKRALTAAVHAKLEKEMRPPARMLRSASYLRSNLQFVEPGVRFFQLQIAANSEEIAPKGDLENWLPFARTYEDVYVGLYLRYWARELNELGPRKNWRLEGQGPVSHYAERARQLVEKGESLEELRDEILKLTPDARSEMRAKKDEVPEDLDAHVEKVLEALDLASIGGEDRQMIKEPLQRALAILKNKKEDADKNPKAYREVRLARQSIPTMGLGSVEKLVKEVTALEARLKALLPAPSKVIPFRRGRKGTQNPPEDNRSELRAQNVSPELQRWVERQRTQSDAAAGIREFARFYEELPQPMRDALSAEMRALADGEREIPRSVVQLARRAWPKGMVQSLDYLSRGDLSVQGLPISEFLKEKAELQESSPEALEGTVLFAQTLFKIHEQLEKRAERRRFIIALSVLAMVLFGKILIEFAVEAAALWGAGQGQQAIERRLEDNRRAAQLEEMKIAEETEKLVSRIVNPDENLAQVLNDLAALEREQRIDVLFKTAEVYKDKAADPGTRARILDFYTSLLVKSEALERDTYSLRLDAFFSLKQFTDPEVVRLIGEGLKRSTELELRVNPKFRSGEENFQISVIFYLSDVNTDEALEPVRDMFPPRISKGEYEEKDYRVKSVIERALQKKDGQAPAAARSELRAQPAVPEKEAVEKAVPKDVKNLPEAERNAFIERVLALPLPEISPAAIENLLNELGITSVRKVVIPSVSAEILRVRKKYVVPGASVKAPAAVPLSEAPVAVNEEGPSLIAADSPLGFLAEGLGIRLYVPASARKSGFWQYELKLTEDERKILHEKIFATKSLAGKPSAVRVVFQNETPVIFMTDGISWSQLPEVLRQRNEEALYGQFLQRHSRSGARLGVARKLADKDMQETRKKLMALGYSAFPEVTGEDGRLFVAASKWVESVNPTAGTYSNELFTYYGTKDKRPIVTFKGVYETGTLSSSLFRLGIRPKRGTKLLVLGTGTGVDAIAAANYAEGDIKILAADIDPLAAANTRYNVSRSAYPSAIDVRQGNLFDIPGRPAGEKYAGIYFNIPLPHGGSDDEIAVSDPGRALLDRLLREAGNYLAEEGTLEINYTESPAFLKRVFETGWEPALIEGADFFRKNMPNNRNDYLRFTLVRQKNTEARREELAGLNAAWAALDAIETERESRRPLSGENRAVIEDLRRKYGEDRGFNAQLILKAASLLLQWDSPSFRRFPIPDTRLNELYPEYALIGETRSELRIPRQEMLGRPQAVVQAALALAPEEFRAPASLSEEEVAADIEEYIQGRGLEQFSQDLLYSVGDLARRLAADFEARGGTDAEGALRYRNLQAVLGMMEELARSLVEEARLRHGDAVDNLHAGAPLAVALDEEGSIATRSGISITPEVLASALQRYKFLLSKVNFVSDGKVADVLRNIKIPNKRIARGSFISGDEILSLIGDAQIKNDNIWQLDISGDGAKLDPFTAELILNLMILVGGLVNYGSGAAEIRKAMATGNPVAELLKQYPGLAMILNQENLQFAMENGRPTLRFHARILQELLSQEALAVSA